MKALRATARTRGPTIRRDDQRFDAVLASIRSGLPTYKALIAHDLDKDAFYAKVADEAGYAESYLRAKEAQCEAMADEIVELSDICREGRTRIKKAEGGTETKIADMVDRTRLQIEARKWLLAKLRPKIFGDKLELGGKPGAPVLVIRDMTGKS